MTGSGVLVVDKAAGVTSFDAVALVRRRLRIKRVGHAGTLDPAATGVLPVLLGEATKLMPYLADQDKEYRAGVRLGLTTDTLDTSGRVLTTAAVEGVTRERVEEVCRGLVGRIRQVPPMYSAVRHGGRRLYELARQGLEVERESREVEVHAIEVEGVDEAAVRLRVVCGKGTYVRVLAADIGRALGTGAAIERLVRTRVGPFRLEEAVDWTTLREGSAESLWARVRPPESAIAGWPALRLDARAAQRFLHGQAVDLAPAGAADGSPVRVHAMDGRLLGVGEVSTGATRVRPVRVLNADRPGTSVVSA